MQQTAHPAALNAYGSSGYPSAYPSYPPSQVYSGMANPVYPSIPVSYGYPSRPSYPAKRESTLHRNFTLLLNFELGRDEPEDPRPFKKFHREDFPPAPFPIDRFPNRKVFYTMTGIYSNKSSLVSSTSRAACDCNWCSSHHTEGW